MKPVSINRLYTRSIPTSPRPADPTSAKGLAAARARRQREVERLAAHEKEKAELRAIAIRQQAESQELKMQAGVAKTVSHFARRAQLSDQDAARLENIVENARRTFRPTAETPSFDVYRALDEAVARVKPQGHIRRERSEMTRDERVQENETYAEKLKRLGLQNPCAPSILGDGLSGHGQ